MAELVFLEAEVGVLDCSQETSGQACNAERSVERVVST
jgi:hypothetical protein